MKELSFRTDVLPLKDELFRLALRITQERAEAEDVVQETMMKVWKRREQWAEMESIEAFCLTVCRNLALDKTRRMERQLRTAPPPTDPADLSHASNPEQVAIERDRLRLVRQLMDQLPEKQRSCMQLRDVEGKSYRDIATVLDITEQQVKINIFRARQTIRERFLALTAEKK